jgi:hypothetical protein
MNYQQSILLFSLAAGDPASSSFPPAAATTLCPGPPVCRRCGEDLQLSVSISRIVTFGMTAGTEQFPAGVRSEPTLTTAAYHYYCRIIPAHHSPLP